jgi:hypothetical protein
MFNLHLKAEEWEHLLACCEGALINPSTNPVDLKYFLLNRLGEAHRGTFLRIYRLSNCRMRTLRAQIIARLEKTAEPLAIRGGGKPLADRPSV